MSARGKTVSDAIALFEDLAQELKDHKGEFMDHVREQRAFNTDITARVVETEKADIRIIGKLDTILDRLNKNQIGWQIWLPFSVTAIISVMALLIQVWPKGVTP